MTQDKDQSLGSRRISLIRPSFSCRLFEKNAESYCTAQCESCRDYYNKSPEIVIIQSQLAASRKEAEEYREMIFELNEKLDAYWNNRRGMDHEKNICRAQQQSLELLKKYPSPEKPQE